MTPRLAPGLLAALLAVAAALPAAARTEGRWDMAQGSWSVLGPDGRPFGQLDLDAGITVSGQGRLGPAQPEVYLEGAIYGAEALVLRVHHGIGDLMPGELLLSEDGTGGLHGTYLRGEDWQLVRLTRTASPPPPDPDPAFPPGEERADLPGIGVSGPPYRLRNVPAGGWVRVHRWARVVSEQFDRRLWREAEDILVLDCDPQTDAAAIEAADAATRLRMMEPLWCLIETTDASGIVTEGWIEGRHLEPMWERMGASP